MGVSRHLNDASIICPLVYNPVGDGSTRQSYIGAIQLNIVENPASYERNVSESANMLVLAKSNKRPKRGRSSGIEYNIPALRNANKAKVAIASLSHIIASTYLK